MLWQAAREKRDVGLTVAVETKADDGKEKLSGTQAETDEIHHGHAEAGRGVVQVIGKLSVLKEDVGRCSSDATGTLTGVADKNFL